MPARVLVADDDVDLLKALGIRLRAAGYEVISAQDGLTATQMAVKMQPDVIILVTGDADFGYLALQLRRRGIRVEVASVAQNLGSGLKSAANAVIDLAPLFATFETL